MASVKPIVMGVAVAACLAGLVACGEGDTAGTSPPSEQKGASASGRPPASTGSTTAAVPPTGGADASPSSTPSRTPPSTDDAGNAGDAGDAGNAGDAATLSESLLFGSLRVRALSYEKSGVGGAANGTRLEVVTVEECAAGVTAQVQHRTWHLVDAAGKTLGVAGGKVVDGHPSEDLPRTLSPGQCLQTELTIGVPMGSDPVAVMDGPSNTWSLDD